MIDQYGNLVPDDLVVLDADPSDLTARELCAINQIDWYEVGETVPEGDWNHLIVVSHEQLAQCIDGGFDACQLKDVGINDIISAFKIAQSKPPKRSTIWA